MKGQVLLLLVPTMPDELRNRLFDRLCSIFPEEFKFMDSSTSNGTFPCTYFTIYNRYSVQVSLCFYLNVLTSNMTYRAMMLIQSKSQEHIVDLARKK